MKLSRVPQLQPLNDSPGSTSSLDSPAFPSVKPTRSPSSDQQSPREWSDPSRTLSFGQAETENSSKFGAPSGLGGNAGANSKAAAALKLLRSSSPVETIATESTSDINNNDMGFVPSFFSGDRNPRPRRGTGNPGPRTVGLFSQSKSNSEPIDELDRMLNNNSKSVSYNYYLLSFHFFFSFSFLSWSLDKI